MTHDESLSPQLTGLAASLANLAPAGSKLNRDTLMYRAGWAAAEAELAESAAASRVTAPAEVSGDSARWLWPSIAAVFAMIALSLGVLHFRPQDETSQPPLVKSPVPTPEKVAAQPASTNVDANAYSQLRKNIGTIEGSFSPFGGATLPGLAPNSPDADYQRLRQELLTP